METVLAMTAATETTRFRVHPQAAHRRVGGEYFVVTGDRAFHRLRLTTAVDLFEAIATRPQSRSDLVALLWPALQSPDQELLALRRLRNDLQAALTQT